MTDANDVSATRTAYDATADAYARWVGTELTAATETAIDRALLDAFAEVATQHTGARVGDIGCGTGRVAGFLDRRDIKVIGVDLSSAMLAIARTAHPHIPFTTGQLAALPLPDRSLTGAVCWYSIIHTPPERLDEVCHELARILRPGGHLLIAFQAGTGERLHRTEAYGRPVRLTTYRHPPDDLIQRLTAAGLHVHTRAERQPELAHETTPQAFLIARTVNR